jgi:S1-C subfamily serine protease
MTLQQGRTPECNYTAKLIARDADMDIALLKLDDIDIAGNKIDLASLPIVDIDYTYKIIDGDVVNAI